MDKHQFNYRSRIKITEATDSEPEYEIPEKQAFVETKAQEQQASSLSLIKVTLGLTVLLFVFAMFFGVYRTLIESFSGYPVVSSIMGLITLALMSALSLLVYQEYRAIQKLNSWSSVPASLDVWGERLESNSEAEVRYQNYKRSLNSGLTEQEKQELFDINVKTPLEQACQRMIKDESLKLSALVLVSPNSFIQTLMVIWIHLRTVKRMAQMLGLGLGHYSRIKLVRMGLQNLALYNVSDIASDEIFSQVSAGLAGQVMNQSADSITAGVLNMRLGKSVMMLLLKPLKEL